MNLNKVLIFCFSLFFFAFLVFIGPSSALAANSPDLNNDDVVDVIDLGILLSNWGSTSKPPADLNQDGHVDVVDLGIMLSNWGSVEPPPPPPSGEGLWISQEEIMQLSMSGSAWNSVYSAATKDWGSANLGDNNSMHDVYTLAGALVAVRKNDSAMRNKVIDGLKSAMNSGLSRALELSRGLQTYIIAADIINYRDSAFVKWVRDMVNANVSGHSCPGVIGTAKCASNNWGGHARASLAAAGLYLNDQQFINTVVGAHKEFIGIPGANDMVYKSTNWHADSNNKVGVNRRGAIIQGVHVSGVLPEDWRRGGEFQWLPSVSGYMWEGMQGFVVTAVLLHRAGLVSFEAGNNAVVRAMNMLYGLEEASSNNPVFENPASGDDTWIPWLVNFYAEASYPTNAAKPGKNMGWTDWTHSK